MPKLFLTEKQIYKLLDLSKSSPRDNCLFEVALCTGFRSGDLANLRVSDVWDGKPLAFLRITMSKTGKTVERHLTQRCQGSIWRYIMNSRVSDSPFLFCSESNRRGYNQPLNRKSVYRIFKKYLGKICTPAELRGNGCHTTRRSMAKIISDKTGRIEPASRWLGHRSIAVTTAYLDMDSYGKMADDVVAGIFTVD